MRILPIAILASSAFAQPPPAALTLTLAQATERARLYSQQLLSADLAARIATEGKIQAKAALLPSATWINGFIYTQPNGTSSGVFVPNDGPRLYTNQANVHADYSPGKRADYQMAIAAEAIARAKVEIAQRGLNSTVVQNYYGMVGAARHYANAQRSLQEATQFLDITRKQEEGGEVAHSDVVKAQIEVASRQRDLREAQLAVDKARIGFGVFLFPDFRQDFAVVDDLDQAATVLPPFGDVEGLALRNSPDVRAAQAMVTQETFGIRSARSALYPTLSADYFFGLQANQYAVHNEFGQNLIGSGFVASVNVPVWNWGATRSKIREAELKLQQARVDLGFTQRQLSANLNSFYLEAVAANSQLISLKQLLDLAEESLRLTLLRYQAGEVTVLEVVDAQRTVVDARNAYDDGRTRYRVALAALQTLTGAF